MSGGALTTWHLPHSHCTRGRKRSIHSKFPRIFCKKTLLLMQERGGWNFFGGAPLFFCVCSQFITVISSLQPTGALDQNNLCFNVDDRALRGKHLDWARYASCGLSWVGALNTSLILLLSVTSLSSALCCSHRTIKGIQDYVLYDPVGACFVC